MLTDEECLQLGQETLPNESSLVQLMLGRIESFAQVDAVLILETVAVTDDPWNMALPELLTRRLSGLPTLISVPDGLDLTQVEGKAAEIGMQITHNIGIVRRALDRSKSFLELPTTEMPLLSVAGKTSIAVIAPRMLLGEPLLLGSLYRVLAEHDVYPIPGTALNTEQVLERVSRTSDAHAPLGEQELFGTYSLLAGKSAIRGILLLAPVRDTPTLNVLQKIKASSHKPTLAMSLAPDQSDWAELTEWLGQLRVDQ